MIKIKGRHRADHALLDPMRPMAGALRQLMPASSGPVSLSTSSPLRQTASSLLLRRLQSTASSSSCWSKTAFPRRALYRPSTPSAFRRSYSSNNPLPPPPKKGATTPVKFWPFFLVVALSSGAYIALVNQRAGESAFYLLLTPRKSASSPNSTFASFTPPLPLFHNQHDTPYHSI